MQAYEREPPFFFQKPTDAIVHSGRSVQYPSATASLQHEVELVVAIGARGKDVSVADAENFIFGYAVGIDLTRRDLQLEARNSGRPWESGKAFDASAPLSGIVRRHEASLQPSSVITLSVNGETRQRGAISELIWSCEEVISRLSMLYLLQPGDLIFTGTPAGVGDLVEGDSVDGQVDGVGRVAITISQPSRTEAKG